MITKIYFRFELMPPKDAELNFRGGPWENFSLTSSFKADKGEFELSGCGKPNRIVTVKTVIATRKTIIFHRNRDRIVRTERNGNQWKSLVVVNVSLTGLPVALIQFFPSLPRLRVMIRMFAYIFTIEHRIYRP